MLTIQTISYIRRKSVLAVLTLALILVIYLYFHHYVKEEGMQMSDFFKTSQEQLQKTLLFSQQQKTEKQREVITRLNPGAKELLLDAIHKASLSKEQIETHLHKDWFLSPSSLPHNLLGRADNTVYFSQEKQDVFVDQYFNKTRNKIFLEVGAVDGVTLSNTLFLERHRNWTGLLIEPNKDFYRKLATVHRKAYCINSCLSLDNSIGIAKFKPAGMIGGVETGYTETMKRRANSEFPGTASVEVFCMPLGLILAALEMYHIDFFSLDVEGAELQILKTIPFDKIKIDLFFIEYVVWNGSTDVAATQKRLEDLREFFKKVGGYKEIKKSNLDVVFARI